MIRALAIALALALVTLGWTGVALRNAWEDLGTKGAEVESCKATADANRLAIDPVAAGLELCQAELGLLRIEGAAIVAERDEAREAMRLAAAREREERDRLYESDESCAVLARTPVCDALARRLRKQAAR